MAEGRPPSCPRCGYDLSGPVPTWRESCPTEGVCSECGLEFDWGNVMSGRVHAPRWLVESDRSFFRPWTWPLTLAALCNPLRFWSRVDMRLEHRPLRIALWLAAPSLLFFALMAVVLGYEFVAIMANFGQPPKLTEAMEIVPPWYFKGLAYELAGRYAIVQLGSMLLWLAIAPAPLLAMFATTKAKQFNWRHIRRGWLYSLFGAQACVFVLSSQGVLSELWGRVPNSQLARTLYREYLNLPLSDWLRYAVAAWLAIFWYAFFARYLRLRHPFYVAAATLVMAAMLAWILYDLTIYRSINPATGNINWWRWDRMSW